MHFLFLFLIKQNKVREGGRGGGEGGGEWGVRKEHTCQMRVFLAKGVTRQII